MGSVEDFRHPLFLDANNVRTEASEELSNSLVDNYSTDQILPKKSETTLKVYKRRWYVLLMFSLYCFTQSAVWNTWGPISSSSKEAFSWSDATIAWLNNWGPGAYVVFGLFFPWLLQVKGLRWAVVPSMLCIFIGTVCRVITSDKDSATILIHIGQFLNGVAGPISGATPTLSSIWFPADERIIATSIASSISALGSALPFVLGPLLVTDFPPNLNETSSSPASTSLSSASHSVLHTMEPGNVT
uniref:Major facilitator superfamily (MFS) profile domain-containing protein n=1 Tax=Biomphalaria glabrata TaxID=6526 RepID=A0A2C9K2I1_BIOGL